MLLGSWCFWVGLEDYMYIHSYLIYLIFNDKYFSIGFEHQWTERQAVLQWNRRQWNTAVVVRTFIVFASQNNLPFIINRTCRKWECELNCNIKQSTYFCLTAVNLGMPIWKHKASSTRRTLICGRTSWLYLSLPHSFWCWPSYAFWQWTSWDENILVQQRNAKLKTTHAQWAQEILANSFCQNLVSIWFICSFTMTISRLRYLLMIVR